MRKKTNKIVFAIFGILLALAIAFSVFSLKRRVDFLNEGNADMAKFCVSMLTTGILIALLSAGSIIILLKRDKRTEQAQEYFLCELKQTPLFETWFLREMEELKEQFGFQWAIGAVVSIPIIMGMAYMLILMLDGIGRLGMVPGCVFLLGAALLMLIRRLTDYHRNYVDPLLKAMDLKLPLPSSREAFAKEILGSQKQQFSYKGGHQFFPSTAFVMQDYCYFRQFGKSGIVINSDLIRIVLKKDGYAAAYRAHLRTSYVMELYSNTESLIKPAWKGYFSAGGEAYHVLELMKNAGMAGLRVEDGIWQR